LRHRGYLFAAALAGLAACGSDSPTGTNANVSGSAAFNYTGGGGGSFSATGAVGVTTPAATLHTSQWATGWKDNTDGSTNVAANVPTTSGKANFFGIVIGRQTVGSSPVDVSCTSSNPACTQVFLIVNTNQQGSTFDFLCELESGTVTITSIANDNVQGTFAGSGTCTQGVTPFGESAWTVTSGSFNVPLIATQPAF